jgi:two-component sensor histidine kinase
MMAAASRDAASADAANAGGPSNPGAYVKALVNILDDFAGEKAHLRETQAALLNILKDFAREKVQSTSMQKAVINVLEDARTEKLRLEATEAAVLNILDDSSAEKDRLQNIQKAIFNILDDLHVEKGNLEKARNQLVQSSQEVMASLREKEILLKEVHHRVKNNLQVISSLISLQLRPIKDPVNREALQACQARVQAISLIHTMLYQSKDYAKVPFSDYAPILANNIFNALGTVPGCISLELAIDGVALPVDKAIPCGLILNELITNALKHGFPNGRHGKIRVVLEKASWGRLQLSVQDDGVGIPAGMDIRQTQSLGMHLVSALTDQLGGELEMSGDKGTRFKVTFATDAASDKKEQPRSSSLEEAASLAVSS